MCGIACVVGLDPHWAAETLRRAMPAIRHRGPDGEGRASASGPRGTAALGHTRLAIIDRGPSGAQPMRHARTGNLLVFNGEIYGHELIREDLRRAGEEFSGRSDSEVLLAALSRHGRDVLADLDGMFAFAFFDAAKGTILLGRDRSGIKPLYYASAPQGLVAASEVRAVARAFDLRTLDVQAAVSHLAFGTVIGPRTIFAGASSLEPGTTLEVALDGRAPSPPASFREPSRAPHVVTMQTASRECAGTVRASVARQLVADVPVAIFLSGGLDSAIIASAARSNGVTPQAFTVAFEAEGRALDEADAASQTARHFELPHSLIRIGEEQASMAREAWMQASDQPSIDGLNSHIIAGAVASRGFKVALSGLGADELFGGYPSFRDVPRAHRLVTIVPSSLRVALALALDRLPRSARAWKAADALRSSASVGDLVAARRRCIPTRTLKSLGLLHHLSVPTRTDAGAIGQQISEAECSLYMANMLLRDTDCQSMAYGLEVRVPFLGNDVLAFARRLPDSLRLPVVAPKAVLRAAFAATLPDHVMRGTKRGFRLPIDHWLRRRWRDWRRDCLASSAGALGIDLRTLHALDRDFAERPDPLTWSRILALATLGDYVDRHRLKA